MNKKIICAVLAAVMALTSLSACGKGTGEQPSGETTRVSPEITTNEDGTSVAQTRLGYSKNDSLNPYEAHSSINIRLLSLVYDSLFVLDSSLNPTGVIARGCVSGTTTLNVMLISTAKFSDGSPVTAQDVISSFELARQSDTYEDRLANFVSASATNSSNVIFTLEKPDIFAQNCLTFPIIKEVGLVKDADGDLVKPDKNYRPLGSGRYVIKEQSGRLILEKNPYRQNFNPAIVCIELEEIKDSTVMNSSLEIGSTCFSFDDLADGSYTRINAVTRDVTMNNLIYIGFNSANEYMENPYIRRAVSAALNRAELCTSAYQGHAKPASTPFNPDWYVLSGASASEELSPQALVEESGLSLEGQKFSIVVNRDNGYKLELANQIKTQLEKIGMYVYISALSKEDYYVNVSRSDFDMYIGEVRLTGNMDLSVLFRGGTCSFALSESMQELSAQRYEQMLSGKCEMMDFINVFSTEMPFVPVCYRTGLALYTNSIDPGVSPCSDCDVYLNIENWTINKAGK